jgi:amino acid transporter
MSTTRKTGGALALEKMRLRRGTLSLKDIVASTLAYNAPAMSFFFGFSGIAQVTGLGSVLTILTAMVVVLFLSNTFAQFSRFMPTAGSFVVFAGKAFGPAVAATLAAFITFGYIILGSTSVVIAGAWVSQTLSTYCSIDVHWTILTLLISLAVGWLAVRGIGISTLWACIFFYFEGGLLLLGALIMLATHKSNLTAAPFAFSNLKDGLGGLGAGFPLAIYLFIGWENSASLAEETEKPRLNVPRALIIGTLTIGLFYVFLAYATLASFKMDANTLNASEIPFIEALKKSAPALVIVAYLAGTTSIVSSLIAGTNSQARILFNSGREGLLPSFFANIHSQHRTPQSAIWILILPPIGLALWFCLLIGVAPLRYFELAGTLGTIPVIFTYMITNLALPIYVVRYHPSELDLIRHLLLPVMGCLVMLLPIWGLLIPGQSWPFNVFPWIAVGGLALSAVYGVTVARLSPRLMDRIGAYLAD